MPQNSLQDAKLYGILDLAYVPRLKVIEKINQLLRAGVGVIQLRAKKQKHLEILEVAKEVLPFCQEAGVPFIINDFPDIAQEVGADGVHIGQDDGSIAAARKNSGGGIVGRSTHFLEQAVAAQEEGADYIGFGPLYATDTKPGRSAIGLEDISRVHQAVSIPIFCIGGINLQTLPEVVAAGAKRAVIVSALLQAESTENYALSARLLLEEVG